MSRIKTYNVHNGSSKSCDECDRPGCQVVYNGVQCGETKTLDIIHEFKQIYEDKMRVIDEEGSGDCGIQAKISLQQDWIRDLTEQNEMLVRAVEALEQEATERVISLEEKLKHSSKSAYEVMNGYKDISINLEETFQTIGHLQNDLQNLVEFIRRARDNGNWSMDDLEFHSIRKADIIGSEEENQIATHLQKYADEKVKRKFKLAFEIVEDVENVYVNKEEDFYVKPYVDENNAEILEFAYKNIELLKQRDKKIEELEAKLQNSCNFNEEMTSAKKAAENYSSLQQSMLDMRDALTAEVADKHDTIVSLRREVQLLEEQCRKADQQTHFKDDIIKELRKEIKQLKQERKKLKDCCSQTSYLTSDNLIDMFKKKCCQVSAKLSQLSTVDENIKSFINVPNERKLDRHRSKSNLRIQKIENNSKPHNIKKELDTCCSANENLNSGMELRRLKDIPDIKKEHLSSNSKISINDYCSCAVNNFEPKIENAAKSRSSKTKCCSDSGIKTSTIYSHNITTNKNTMTKYVHNANKKENEVLRKVGSTSSRSICSAKDLKTSSIHDCPMNTKKDENSKDNICEQNIIKERNKNSYSNCSATAKQEKSVIISDSFGKIYSKNNIDANLSKHQCKQHEKNEIKILPNKNKEILQKPSQSISKVEMKSSSHDSRQHIKDELDINIHEHTRKKSNDYNIHFKEEKDILTHGDVVEIASDTKSANITKSNLFNKDLNKYLTLLPKNQMDVNSQNKTDHGLGLFVIDYEENADYNAENSLEYEKANILRVEPIMGKETKKKNKSDKKKKDKKDKQPSDPICSSTSCNNTITDAMLLSVRNPFLQEFLVTPSTSEELEYNYNTPESNEKTSDIEKTKNIFGGFQTFNYRASVSHNTYGFDKMLSKQSDDIEMIIKNAPHEMMFLQMHKQMEDLLKDLHEKDKQIMDLHDLVSISVQRLMLVFNALNILHSRVDEISNLSICSGTHAEHNCDGLKMLCNEINLTVEKLRSEAINDLVTREQTYEGCPELKSKALQMEKENDELRRAITKATQQLEILEDKAEGYMNEKSMLQKNCADKREMISCLKCERDDLLKQLQCVQKDCCKLNEENVNNMSCYNELKEESGSKISLLHDELNKIKNELMQSQNHISELCTQNEEYCCTIQSLQQSTQHPKPCSRCKGVDPIPVQRLNKAQNIPSRVSIRPSHRSKRSPQKNDVSWDTEYYSDSSEYCDVSILKGPASNVTRRSCSRDSSPSSRQDRSALRTEAKSLEGAIHGLRASVSRMMLSECKNNEARKRIADLEEQLQKNSRKDEMIDIQNDTLNIIENELQAWRFKDTEIEKARQSRDLEIKNMKETIATLLSNLHNEKMRSENLQKAVDLYLNSINVLQETEDRFKRELNSCVCVIDRLWNVILIADKKLQKYINVHKTFSNLIEQLYDENLALEVELFQNNQDIEIYEMRVLKYQHLCNNLQIQCSNLEKSECSCEEQKLQHSEFVDELTLQLSDCQDELKNLFQVLNDEQNVMENETINFSHHIIALQQEINVLSQKLAYIVQCLENEKKVNAILELQLTKKDCESAYLKTEIATLNDKLCYSASEIGTYQTKMQLLQDKLFQYQDTLNGLDKESSACQKNVQYCMQNLKDTEIKLASKIEECDTINAKYAAQLSLTTCLEGQIDNIKSDHNDELIQYGETLRQYKDKCNKANEELQYALEKLNETADNESKIQEDYKNRENKFKSQINEYHREQDRLLSLIDDLEQRLNNSSTELCQRNQKFEELKHKFEELHCGTRQQIQLHQEDVCNLKNEINILIQKLNLITSENEEIRKQLEESNDIINKYEEKKQAMIRELGKCLSELQQIKGDNEFLIQKNQDLTQEMQRYQDAWESNTPSHSTADTIRSEGISLVHNVRSWLAEQKKTNNYMTEKMRQKNTIINQLKEENRILEEKLKRSCCNRSSGTIVSRLRGGSPDSSSRMESPSPSNIWHVGSVESPGASSNETDWEEEEHHQEGTPRVWLHQVASLTEELQRSNRFWKNRVIEQVVTKDK